MSLQVASTMFVPTSEDTRLIQLCFGDITRLPVEDKVDVILISAFPNDYVPTPGSLIGALYHVLNVNVRELAKNRAEDLRRDFHCWTSKDLPNNLPYRQLICFEKTFRDNSTHDQAVAEVFRAMMPVFNNCSKSVITPILATGCQGENEIVMLPAMLQAAVNWMRAGLPLQLLKIVIYTHGDSTWQSSKLIEIFDKYKRKVEKLPRVPQIVAVVYDIFLIHSEEDKQLVEQIIKCFNSTKKRFKKSVCVITVLDVAPKEATWQYDVVSAMMASTSVVALMTNSFMSNGKCLDQYNLAICADRRSQRRFLAPIMFDELTNIPVYMSSIQWFNCKSREEKDIKEACLKIIDRSSGVGTSVNLSYDVFISYSHQNIQKAKRVLHALKSKCSDIRVFFDYDELRTVDKWQLTLYRSMDAAKCVIVLLSPDYLKSAVCNEELNLALARHLSSSGNKVEMILLCVEDVDRSLPLFRLVDLTSTQSSTDIDKLAGLVASSVSQWLMSNKKDELFSCRQTPYDFSSLNKALRRKSFSAGYVVDATGFVRFAGVLDSVQPPVLPVSTMHEAGVEDVFISCEARDQRYACFLATELRRRGYSVIDESSSEDFSIIEKTKCAVVMLSDAFQHSVHKIDVLNLALTRLRSKHAVYFIAIDILSPSTPTYVNLTQYSVCLRDELWQETLTASGVTTFAKEIAENCEKTELKHGKLLTSEVLALMKVACDIEKICQLDSSVLVPSTQKGCLQDIVSLCADSEVINGKPSNESAQRSVETSSRTDESQLSHLPSEPTLNKNSSHGDESHSRVTPNNTGNAVENQNYSNIDDNSRKTIKEKREKDLPRLSKKRSTSCELI